MKEIKESKPDKEKEGREKQNIKNRYGISEFQNKKSNS